MVHLVPYVLVYVSISDPIHRKRKTMKAYTSAMLTRSFLSGLLVAAVLPVIGRNPDLPPGAKAQPVLRPKAAACVPASDRITLEYNNVRAIIENGGNMWQRRGGNSLPGYEIPKSTLPAAPFSGASSIFAGGLWMGGVSSDNQLKLAAVLFRAQGNDFWPGPLNNTNASVEAETCLAYDRFWVTERAQVETYIQWYQCQNDPECDLNELFPDGYSIPSSFISWPAEGNLDQGQDLYLAPFVDADGDGSYSPASGDYPDYGLDETVEECKSRQREDPVNLFGDHNIFWIFNDKGDVHTESFGGEAIGLEVRAQAFAFSSNNEVNNMTFYNFTVINQGEQTLNQTYFGHFVDPDLGCSNDDFVGCDVQRGFGFAYNWDENDENCNGTPGYGIQPPAVGVDFFEGPYQDADGVDNPGPATNLVNLDCVVAQQQNGIPYKGLGIGYGDGFADNERFGMRAFLFWNREGAFAVTDPGAQGHFYNYLRGIWKNNVTMSYGGSGYDESPGATPTRYMFPWSSDPVGWGTNCIPQPDWRETAQQPIDRRFVQSAGPFTLEPGAYNNITLGVAWARAQTGGAVASVAALRVADDKAQSLFDNCFKILDGPDAPDLEIVELDRELIIFMTNPEGSNNNQQVPINLPPLSYEELDPNIPEVGSDGQLYDRFYRFQGYKLYQLKNADVSVADLDNVELARLVYQGDLEDNVAQIINYPLNELVGQPVPTEMVNGANVGVASSVRVTEDKFAQGDPRLVNFKSYYYMAIAYGYNNFEPYNVIARTGQAFSYVASRKAAFGSIRRYVGIPHRPDPATGGTILNAGYGDSFEITRLEGQGNGGNSLSMKRAESDAIAIDPSWRKQEFTYERGAGPVTVKVIDPLKVPLADFEIWMKDDTITPGNLNDANWYIVNLSTGQQVNSERIIDVAYEQVIPDWGISVTINQAFYSGDFTEPAGEGRIEFADPSRAWFTGIPDGEGDVPTNWIRSGVYSSPESPLYADRSFDPEEKWENILGGTWAPWGLVGQAPYQGGTLSESSPTTPHSTILQYVLRRVPSVQVVITSDKSLWSRSPVFEQDGTGNAVGGATRMALRASPSIDKAGRKAGDAGYDQNEGGLVSPTGMGWFPGYAIDLETGERLNIGYGEDSFLGGGRGRDMIWNPNDEFFTELGSPYFGGCHWIYVFRNERRIMNSSLDVPQYDQGAFIRNEMQGNTTPGRARVFKAISWVGSAMVVPGREFMATDVRITLGVKKAYERYMDYSGGPGNINANARNNGLPLYKFSTSGLETINNDQTTAESALDLINVVPNPYYAFSGYETSRIDNRVKFINLPQRCTVSIYTVSGTLVRKFRKDNELTFLDWDLKNTANIPISGGMYLCHVDVPGVGEKVVKWFGAMRPLDLQNF